MSLFEYILKRYETIAEMRVNFGRLSYCCCREVLEKHKASNSLGFKKTYSTGLYQKW